MTAEQVEQWLVALKSGRYHQAQRLFTVFNAQNVIVQHCCLAVFSDIQHRYFDNEDGRHLLLPTPTQISGQNFGICVQLNDNGPTDQYQRVIADIEGALEDYITER